MIGEWNNGTGRRKSSVARVFLKKGSGKITINGRDIAEFFGRQTSIMIAKQPLVLTNNAEAFDIQVNVHGGGESGQAGAARHGITRALIDYDAALKPQLSAAGFVACALPVVFAINLSRMLVVGWTGTTGRPLRGILGLAAVGATSPAGCRIPPGGAGAAGRAAGGSGRTATVGLAGGRAGRALAGSGRRLPLPDRRARAGGRRLGFRSPPGPATAPTGSLTLNRRSRLPGGCARPGRR